MVYRLLAKATVPTGASVLFYCGSVPGTDNFFKTNNVFWTKVFVFATNLRQNPGTHCRLSIGWQNVEVCFYRCYERQMPMIQFPTGEAGITRLAFYTFQLFFVIVLLRLMLSWFSRPSRRGYDFWDRESAHDTSVLFRGVLGRVHVVQARVLEF